MQISGASGYKRYNNEKIKNQQQHHCFDANESKLRFQTDEDTDMKKNTLR